MALRKITTLFRCGVFQRLLQGLKAAQPVEFSAQRTSSCIEAGQESVPVPQLGFAQVAVRKEGIRDQLSRVQIVCREVHDDTNPGEHLHRTKSRSSEGA